MCKQRAVLSNGLFLVQCDVNVLCLQVEELEEKLSDQTQEVERLRSELVRPCWITFLRNPGNSLLLCAVRMVS